MINFVYDDVKELDNPAYPQNVKQVKQVFEDNKRFLGTYIQTYNELWYKIGSTVSFKSLR